jgi:hypothetical protein
MESEDAAPVGEGDELEDEGGPSDPIQESEEESFPASDPPSQWAG